MQTHTHTHPVSFTDKDYKAVSGHGKHVASLNGVTTMEKEKFPKNFWPDVSIRMKRGWGGWAVVWPGRLHWVLDLDEPA